MSDQVRERFMNPSVRDFSLVLLCIVLVILCRARDSYNIRPVWRHDLELDHYANGKFPTNGERLPLPKITDLNNDGINEVILITNDHYLIVGISPPHNHTKRVLPHLMVKHDVRLPDESVDAEKRSQPIILDTGYLMPLSADKSLRKQVIIVVLNNWKVLCYDDNLNLLWTNQLLELDADLLSKYQIKSMAVIVTSVSMNDADRGAVIVGASFEHMEPSNPEFLSELHETNEGHPAADEDALCQFSTFSLSGSTGEVRWFNIPGRERPFKNRDVFKSFRKEKKKKKSKHSGLNLENLLHLLPHSWSNIYDTLFSLIHLDNSGVQTDDTDQNTAPLARLMGLDSDYLHSYARAHTKQEHVRDPNALVIYTHDGIHVLNILRGDEIGEMRFNEKHVYADVQYDSDIEKIYLKTPGYPREGCSLVLGKTEQDYVKVDVCDTSESLTVFGMFSSAKKLIEDPKKAMVPVVVPSVAKKTGLAGVIHHISGETLRSRKRIYDVIAYSSSGVVMSLGGKGEVNFKTSVPAIWSHMTSQLYDDVRPMRPEEREVYDQLFQPSITPLSLHGHGRKDKLLTLAWDHIALVDLYDGYMLGSINLPCQTYSPLATGDFNNDGVTDILLHCPVGYIAFSLEPIPHYWYTGMIGLAVVLLVLLLTWCCSPEMDDMVVT